MPIAAVQVVTPRLKKTCGGASQRRLPPKKWLLYRYWLV